MRFAWILLVPLMVGVSAPAHAQHHATQQPHVTMEAARKTALARVPHRRWSRKRRSTRTARWFTPSTSRWRARKVYEEVMVDAMTGHVMSVKHESAGQEAKKMKKATKKPMTQGAKKPAYH